MRKIKLFLLVSVLALSVVGCSGGDKKEDETPKVTNDAESDNQDSDTKEETDGKNDTDANYTMYDDLGMYVKVPFHEIYISAPTWREESTLNGYYYTDSTEYLVSITYESEEVYDGAIEDILDYTYPYFTYSVGDHAVTEQFGEYELTTKEKVTLDCGVDAMKFEGTMKADEYSRVVDYYIYGYSFVYDGATITVGASVVYPDTIEQNKDKLIDYVDRMVKTVRTTLE